MKIEISRIKAKNHFTTGRGGKDNMPACGVPCKNILHKVFTDPRKVNCKNCRRTKGFVSKDLGRGKSVCPK